MNKILKRLFSVAIISASFASCSQVDTIDNLDELKAATSVTLHKHSDWPQLMSVVFATNVYGTYNKVFYYNNNGTVLNNIPAGAYKFYLVNRYTAYQFANVDFNSFGSGIDSLYYGDVVISCPTAELTNVDEGVKKVLPGKYFQPHLASGILYGDSTMLVNVEMGQSVNVTFEKPYTLTTEYTVSGSFQSSLNVEKIYVELSDVIAAKRPNGAVAGSKRVKCVFDYPVAKNSKKDLAKKVYLLGIANSGTANIYVRCKGDDKSKTPETTSVRYTVKDGVIKLGDITF